ncbi:MAG: aminomethyltransferase, partial [Primorskyibacter sp.]
MLDDIYPKVVPGPPKPSGIFEPCVFSMPPGVERYVVSGGGAILVRLEPGDGLEVENTEGGQPCEIVTCGPDGISDPAMVDATATGAPTGLMALLASQDHSLRSLRMGIESRGIDLSACVAIRVFDTTTPAKECASFRAKREGTAIIAAPHSNPSGIMDFDAQDTVTPLTVYVRRAVIKSVAKFAL